MSEPTELPPPQVIAFAPVDLGNGTHADLVPSADSVLIGIYSNSNFATPLKTLKLSYEGYAQLRDSYPNSDLPKLKQPDPSGAPGPNPNSGPTQGKGAAPPVVRMVPNVVAGRIYTVDVGPPPKRPGYQRVAAEAARVLDNTVEDWKQSLQTVWEALPGTSQDEVAQAARERIKDGVVGSVDGVITLLGAPPGMEMMGTILDDPDMVAMAQEMSRKQQAAAQAIVDSIKQAWNEADERSGTAGALAMVGTTLLTELVAGKGTKAAGKIGDVARVTRKLPDSPPRGHDGFTVVRGKKRLSPGPYRRNGYDYTTDANGRIKTVEGELRLDQGERSSHHQKNVGVNDGRLPTDDGGHLIGARFGGDGGLENLTPMSGKLNRGKWKKMENKWAKKLESGDTVKVKIELIYGDDTMRATHFKVTEIINGKPKIFTIPNT